MSLTYEQFKKAQQSLSIVKNRLLKLIGCNPTTVDHYGIIRLYNQRINEQTSDEELIKIRSTFLSWKKDMLSILAEYNIVLDDATFKDLFHYDIMFGTIYFLTVALDIYKKPDEYREIIEHLLNNEDTTPSCQNHYRSFSYQNQNCGFFDASHLRKMLNKNNGKA